MRLAHQTWNPLECHHDHRAGGAADRKCSTVRLRPAVHADGFLCTRVLRERLFNLTHLDSGIKVDLIVRKGAEYRQIEFARRQPVDLSGAQTWIVTREDLILSKLVWAHAAQSELQMRDVRQLMGERVDIDYLHRWAPVLGVAELLEQVSWCGRHRGGQHQRLPVS